MGPVIAMVTKDDPDLKEFDDAQKQAFLHFWQQGGDAAALVAALENHPGWQAFGWRAWAAACAELGQQQRACAIAAGHATKPVIPPAPVGVTRPLGELQGDASRSPKDPVAALQLYFAEMTAGDKGAALAALHRITLEPGCPPYFFYLAACRAGELGQWKDAWEAWEKYLEKTGADH